MTQAVQQWRPLIAEALGTFALVFFGTGAAMVQAQTGALGHAGVALVFGLVVATCIVAFGPVSGCHINPAATLGLVIGGKFPKEKLVSYWLVQLLGAVLASALLWLLFGNVGKMGATLPAGSPFQSLVLEAVMTAFLLLVAFRSGLAWAIGAVVALEALMGGPISGASMNPARSFGPAVVGGFWEAHWVYWLGPLAGGALAAWLDVAIFGTAEPVQLDETDLDH